jgi:hypothetical protein
MEALAHHTPGPFSWKPQLAASSFPTRRFLPPLIVDEHVGSFIVRDTNGQCARLFLL